MYDSGIRICLVLSVLFTKRFTFNTKYKLIPPWAEEKNNMKKLAIASASLALAAVPVAGVFAAGSQSFTDDITVNIADACTMETSATPGNGTYADRVFSEDVTAGSKIEFGNSNESGSVDPTISVICNTTTAGKTWSVKATASTDGDTESPKAALKDGSNFIKSGTATLGDTSTWAMKMNNVGGNSDYSSAYTAVPAGENTVVLTADASSSNVTFRPSYQVYAAPKQAPGTYKGSVVYKISMNS